MLIKVVATLVGIVVLAALWFKAPQVIVAGFDTNLAVIKFLAHLVPAPYGAMGEVALRGLGADRALMFGEATLVMRGVFFLIAKWRNFTVPPIRVPAPRGSGVEKK